MSATALIFDVQRFCIHDGPGIRTVVFFKGCTLRCAWCQNPESLAPRSELAVYAERCLGSMACEGRCESACPHGALVVHERAELNWDRCDDCGACTSDCPTAALRTIGEAWTVERVVSECVRDREFYLASGGGVTLSGGEPILQGSFLRELLPRLREESLSVVLETAGAYSWDKLAPLLEHLDHVYFDWKAPVDDYPRFTGGNGGLVAENLAKLIQTGTPTTVRMPLVCGVNTEPAAVNQIAETLGACRVRALALLPYNGLWEAKRPRLRGAPPARGSQPEIDITTVVAQFARKGIEASWTTPVQGPSTGRAPQRDA